MSAIKFDTVKTKIENAANGHYYLHVVKKDDVFKTTNIKLSGYIQFMSKDNNFIYMPTHRLAGNVETLATYLYELGFDEEAVRGYVESAYTVHNYEARRSEIDAEIASIPRKEKGKSSLPSLEYIITAGAVLKTTKSLSKDGVPEPTTPKEKPNLKDLRFRLLNLEDGQALDVTNFDPVTKNGVKTVKRTNKGAQRSLGTTPELNRIVFNFNMDNGIAVKFLQTIGKAESDAIKIVEAAKKAITNDLSKLAVK